MNGPQVARLTENPDGKHEFEVSLGGGYVYRVNVPEEYYQKLTGGVVTPDELIKHSFEFLLMREAPDAILREFDLPLINQYFPEYEKEMLARYKG